MCIGTPCKKLNVYWNTLLKLKCVLGHPQKVECVLGHYVIRLNVYGDTLHLVICVLGHPV